MKKIKICAFALALAIISTLFTGCYTGPVVKVYNWGEYIDESIFTDFENETGIRVRYKTFGNNEEMYAKLKSGGSSYDIIIPSDYMISRMIEEDMLEKLDMNNIPNFGLVSEKFADPEYDPGSVYSAPYMWGTVGIVYNKTLVDEKVDSWDILFDKKYENQVLMFDNSRDALGVALKQLGYSLNTTDESELNDAYDLLLEQKPIVQAYVMDQIYNKMISGEAALGTYYAGDAIEMIGENSDLGFVVPLEGSNVFVDAMCIPKGAKNKENAEKFINFMLKKETMLKNADETGYAVPTDDAYAALPDDVKNDTIIYPPQEILEKCQSFINLPRETRELYDSLWTRLKSK